MRRDKVKKILPWAWILLGISDVVCGVHTLLNDPVSILWIGDIFFGGAFILIGIWWYVETNKLSSDFVVLSGMLFGMILTFLAIYRANFLTHGYDLASNAAFLLGISITSACALLRRLLNSRGGRAGEKETQEE